MKIAVLSCADLGRAQYLYKYLDLLDKLECSYDVIYWNRTLDDIKIKCQGDFIGFDLYVDSYKPLYKKIVAYIKFAQFVSKQIRVNKYDKLIVLTTQMAFVVLPFLMFSYKGKYIFDYRDLTKEYLGIYRYMVNKIADISETFVVSSQGYLKYFSKNILEKYCLCHNTFAKVSFKKELRVSKERPIRIAYWGAVRQVDYNKKVCDLFGRDERFKVVYHGDGAYNILDSYCKEMGYSNISFTGKYNLEDISSFANNSDILFNAYEQDFVTTPSLAVKVYDSLEYRLPMLVSAGTYMEKYLSNYSYVYPFEVAKESLDKIYKWYSELDEKNVENDFKAFMTVVSHDEEIFENCLRGFLNKL